MENLEQYVGRYFSLSESAALWEPKLTFRTLQSWVSGQTLRIKPSHGRGVRRSGKYGLLSQLKFAAAAHLLKAGLPSRGVQIFLDKFADADFLPQKFAEKMSGRFILAEDPTDQDHLNVWLFRDEEKFWAAVKVLSEQTPLRHALIHFEALLREVLGRIQAWDERRGYLVKSAGDEIAKVLTSIRESNLCDEVSANTALPDASNAVESVVSRFLELCPDFPNTPEAIKALAAKFDDMWGLAIPPHKD